MNKLFVYVVLSCIFFSSYAQRKGNNQHQIDPAQIPAAVKASQESAFPDVTVIAWETRNLSGHGQFVSKYTAVFTQEEKKNRARYKGDGTLVSLSKYFNSNETPSLIKNLESKYNGYDLKSTEQIKTYLKEKVYYRAHFYKGKKKVIVYVDDNGKELGNDKVPPEVKEDEDMDS
jgi:hypothetical protein